MTKRVDPLDWRVPITDSSGRPTQEFTRKWTEQASINGQVPSSATAMSGALDLLGKTIGALLVRGASAWGMLIPSAANKILKDNGAGNSPSWDTLSDVIDGAISNTQGSILYRGASAWAVLGPGTAGYLLQTAGVSANPTWIAPLSAANPTGTASDTVVNGTAATFMRSDAAPAIQKASATVFGCVKVDGSTITAVGGVISSSGGGGGGAAFKSYTNTFSSGGTATVPNDANSYGVKGVSNGISFTIVMPAAPTDGQQVMLYVNESVSNTYFVTVSANTGQTIVNNPSVMNTNYGGFMCIWQAATSKWVCLTYVR